MAKRQREARILTIDGAGLKAIVPALLLAHIEKVTGKPIVRSFHFCAATSASSLLPLALSSATAGGKSMSAEQLGSLIVQHGSKIYGSEFWTQFKRLNLGGQGFRSSKRLARLTRRLFKNLNLSDCDWDVFLPLFDMESGQGYQARSWLAKDQENVNSAREHDFKLRALGEVCFAPPTIFGPKLIWDQRRRPRNLVDATIAQSNPITSGLKAAQKLYDQADHWQVLSLGVGIEQKEAGFLKNQAWSSAGWTKPLFEINSKIHQEQSMIHAEDSFPNTALLRLDPALRSKDRSRSSYAWGNLDNKSVEALKLAARSLILEAQHNGLADFCAHLIENPLVDRNELIGQNNASS